MSDCDMEINQREQHRLLVNLGRISNQLCKNLNKKERILLETQAMYLKGEIKRLETEERILRSQRLQYEHPLKIANTEPSVQANEKEKPRIRTFDEVFESLFNQQTNVESV